MYKPPCLLSWNACFDIKHMHSLSSCTYSISMLDRKLPCQTKWWASSLFMFSEFVMGQRGAWRTPWELCVCVCCVCFACVWVHLSEGECDGVSRQLRTETSVLSPLYKSNRKPQGSCHFATNVLSAREKEFISVFQSVCIQGSVACFPTQLLKRHCGKC